MAERPPRGQKSRSKAQPRSAAARPSEDVAALQRSLETARRKLLASETGRRAAEYENELESVASAFRRKDHYFDLMLLGLGDEAHIASIFPGSELLVDVGRPFTGRRVAAVWVPRRSLGEGGRITLTPAAILDSEKILVLVAGSKKATAVHAALEASLHVPTSPAQLLRAARDRVEWFLDRAATARL